MALTGKKRRFADAVEAGLSNKKAAIQAGYSEATASAAGSRLVKDPDVKAYRERIAKSASGGSATEVSLEAQPNGGALKRTKATPVEIGNLDMLQLLQDVALGRIDATTVQVRAAIAAVQYTHTKKGDGGKKDEQGAAAKRAANKFAPSAPPKLAAANGRKV